MLYAEQAGEVAGNIQDVNELQLLKVLANVLTFIFDGKTMFFNCRQPPNAVFKETVAEGFDTVAGKYTVCKFAES